MRKTRSAKGDVVDFDMLEIKQQMANIPTHVNVSTRQQYVDEKSSKAKIKPGTVPEYIQSADWNVLSTEPTSNGDVEMHISQPVDGDNTIEPTPTTVSAKPIKKK